MAAALRCWILPSLWMFLLCAGAAAEPLSGPEFDPVTGYRIARYRAPLPDEAPPAARIFAADVPALRKNKNAILVDVMVAEGAGFDPATGGWRLAKVHDNIPGSVWLPDVGKGVIDAGIDAYFRRTLDRLTHGDRARALIIYCQSDCWMSWNAVRRAASYGYTQLYWLPEGVDGWRDWYDEVTPAIPVPVQP